MKHFFTRRLFITFAILGFIFGGIGGYFYLKPEPTFGAPIFRVERSLIPETTNTYFLGTTTPSTVRWANIFTTDLNISGTCTGCSGFSYPFPSDATTTLLTFNGGIIVNGASSTINRLNVNFGTTTEATSTNSYISNNLTVDATTKLTTYTSALLLTGTTGVIAEYAGTSCTNQFVRSLSALGVATCATVVATDVDLADLTATNATLTFSGTYDGQIARTIGLNLGNANTWTALQTFNSGLNSQASSTISALFSDKATTTQATSTNIRATSLLSTANLVIDETGLLSIPISGNPTVSTSGDCAWDNTQASTSLRCFDGTAERQLSPIKTISVPIRNASTTIPTNGSTTIPIITFQRPVTVLDFYCFTNSWRTPQLMGTTSGQYGDGNNFSEILVCGNASSAQGTATSTAELTDQDGINDDDGSLTNSTFTYLETLYLRVGNWIGTADDVIFVLRVREDAD